MKASETINLYWRSGEKSRNLVHKPFESEQSFESYIFDNQELLGDVFILYRQVRTGSRQGIPDMVGVDKDSRICIIEMKNEEVTEAILPQVMSYAIWAETNPDSIKAIWLESKRKPEEIEIEWDNLEIRVIVVAPSFRSTVSRMAGKIGYPIDLISIRRFNLDEQEFLLVETIEEEPEAKIGTTKAMQDWDWEYYESEHGSQSTSEMRRVVEELDEINKQKGWDLPWKTNKYYVGFYLGNRVVFAVSWGGTHAWKVQAKVPETIAKNFKSSLWELQRYDPEFNDAIIRPLDPKSSSAEDLIPLLEAALKNISGGK